MDRPCEHEPEAQKPDTKGHGVYDSMDTKCPEKADLWRREVGWWLPEVKGKWEWE